MARTVIIKAVMVMLIQGPKNCKVFLMGGEEDEVGRGN
jgi:hypothetical protein